MNSPFLFDGPGVISFSGGRTSGMMLWMTIQAYGGTLPANVVVCFANTGKEEEATLEFVRDCGERWGVPIVWIENRPRNEARGKEFAIVDFTTASRSPICTTKRNSSRILWRAFARQNSR